MAGGFSWQDGERLIRFGSVALADAPALLRERGFDGYTLLTTERALAGAPALAEPAAEVITVPSGKVADLAAQLREAAGERPLVALGGGRVIDTGKSIAAMGGLPCPAVPTTLSGAELSPRHRLPSGVEGVSMVRPSLVIADPALMASRPMPDLAASAMNALGHALEALYVPSANRSQSSPRCAPPLRSPTAWRRPSRCARSSRSACCWPATRSGPPAWRCTTWSARRSWPRAPRAPRRTARPTR